MSSYKLIHRLSVKSDSLLILIASHPGGESYGICHFTIRHLWKIQVRIINFVRIIIRHTGLKWMKRKAASRIVHCKEVTNKPDHANPNMANCHNITQTTTVF